MGGAEDLSAFHLPQKPLPPSWRLYRIESKFLSLAHKRLDDLPPLYLSSFLLFTVPVTTLVPEK